MKPTIRDVAKKANVSVATVSRVVNGLGHYSKETEEKVLKIIKEVGYEPNAIAKGLATKQSNLLGVLLPDAATTVYGEVLTGIEEAAQKHGYNVIVCNTGVSGVKTIDYLKVLSSNQIAGLIYASSPLFEDCFELIHNKNLPCVLALTLSYKFQVPYVKVDDKQAAYSATKYLIDRGHEKIALITGSKEDPIAGKPRIEGYIDALKDHNLQIDENLIYLGDFSYESGQVAMEKLLKKKIKFTAIFATSDDMAIGALNVAHKSGISVPKEISIIGYDNAKVSKMSYPELTTVSQPLYEIGKIAVEKLLKMLLDREKVENSILPHEIIERGTVKHLLKK